MGVSDLPFEILTQVAYNLPARDKRSCARTCKRWKYPFQMALWRNIKARDYSDIQKIINSIKASQSIYPLHSLWVHSLHMHHSYGESNLQDINLSDLFRNLPNLKRLELEVGNCKDIYTEIPRSDEIWKSLESLKIKYSAIISREPPQNVLEFINACTMLQKLEIHKHGEGYRMEFNVDDFNSMHQNLRILSSIKAKLCLRANFPATLDTIPNTTPAFGMMSLDIDSRISEKTFGYIDSFRSNWNPLWLYYFGYKYPNLRSLKLNATDAWEKSMDLDKRQRIISLFQSNTNAFKHLETLVFTTNEHFQFSDFILWELLWALKVPLKHLTVDTTYNGEIDGPYPMTIGRILQFVSETLKSLSIIGPIYSDNDKKPTLELSHYFPFLTNLCISGSNVSLNLDDVLGRCVTLKQLKICGGRLFINPSMTTEESKQQQQQQQHHHPQQQYGLQTLKLYDCTISAKVFNHLSFRCRSLKHMNLNTLCILGSVCEKTGCLLLDMSHTFLKTLYIGQIRYSRSYEEMKANDYINMTLLSQLNDAPLSDEESERKKNEMDLEYSTVDFGSMNWLHTYEFDSDTGAKDYVTVRLSAEEVDSVLEYFKNFQSSRISSTFDDSSSCDGQETQIYWNHDLHKGYGELRLGNIEAVQVICAQKDNSFRKYAV
ncbi:hypothetical protein F4703DRAFT_1794061 [Phycomyces blakesleeanus]